MNEAGSNKARVERSCKQPPKWRGRTGGALPVQFAFCADHITTAARALECVVLWRVGERGVFP